MKSKYDLSLPRHGFGDWIERICTKSVKALIYAILISSILSAVVCLIVFSIKHPDVFSVLEFVWILPGLLLLLLIFVLSNVLQKIRESFFIALMIALGCAISAVMIASYNTVPVVDYKAIWDGAVAMANGTFTDGLNPAAYMYYYNWQLGIAAFESLFLRLGANFFFFKIFNACLLILIDLMEYLLVKRRFGEKPARCVYVLATFFLSWCLTIPQFSNHHIGLVFLLLVFCLIEADTILSWALAGVLAACLNVLRPLGIIVLCSVICMALYRAVTIKQWVKPLVRLVLYGICYLSVIALFDSIFLSAGYTDAKISESRIPYFKFQKGLYAYSDELQGDLEAYHYDYDSYNAQMKKDLIETVTEKPVETAVFVANKMARYLGLFDYQFEMTYNNDIPYYTGYPVKALYSTSWFQYIGILALAMLGLKEYYRKYRVDIYQVFFIGHTLVYLLIEALSEYRFENYPLLLMFAALGMNYINERSNRFRLRRAGVPMEELKEET
ncbi:MAG: hypothetical protein LLF75_01260 [Eubacteriales bacterium]|nr:hypothetical protein [Eubacteriales bacterium]